MTQKQPSRAKGAKEKYFKEAQMCFIIERIVKFNDENAKTQFIDMTGKLVRHAIMCATGGKLRFLRLQFDDLVQIAYAKLFKVLQHYNPDRAAAYTWINHVVQNAVRDAGRGKNATHITTLSKVDLRIAMPQSTFFAPEPPPQTIHNHVVEHVIQNIPLSVQKTMVREFMALCDQYKYRRTGPFLEEFCGLLEKYKINPELYGGPVLMLDVCLIAVKRALLDSKDDLVLTLEDRLTKRTRTFDYAAILTTAIGAKAAARLIMFYGGRTIDVPSVTDI